MGAKTHPARTIKFLNFGLQWLRLLASLRCRPTVCAGGASDGWINWTRWQPWWEPFFYLGLFFSLSPSENHETRISFDSGAFSATAHKHMYFILSLNQVFHDLHLYVFSIKYNEYWKIIAESLSLIPIWKSITEKRISLVSTLKKYSTNLHPEKVLH